MPHPRITKTRPASLASIAILLLPALTTPAPAHDISSPANPDIAASFDITEARAEAASSYISFQMTVAGKMAAQKPPTTGKLAGAGVFAYVWPTSIDAGAAGFAPGSGILALAVTAHPDFDDTPLFDEDGDGDPANDGADWHSHWVVLAKDAACGEAGLKVRDILPGEKLAVPPTHPGLPLLIDSPGYSPLISQGRLEVRAALGGGSHQGAGFDAVTAELTVNDKTAAPLLCVTRVHDIASGDLSLPGRIMAKTD
jgi:hypothetical protein